MHVFMLFGHYNWNIDERKISVINIVQIISLSSENYRNYLDIGSFYS